MTAIKKLIIFEDTQLLVINKTAGLLSQGEESGDENLVDLLRAYLGRPYVGLVHRLDRNTSGLMVVAKRTKAARRLTEALKSGELERSYLALIHGRLSPTQQNWKHQLLKDQAQRKVRVVKEGGQSASLKVELKRVLNVQGHDLSLVEFRLETGRSHQIRVQSAYEGHPLLGDYKYKAPSEPAFNRPALHSQKLSFPHPISGENLFFDVDLPPDMKKVVNE